jgi:hypothetical protein
MINTRRKRHKLRLRDNIIPQIIADEEGSELPAEIRIEICIVLALLPICGFSRLYFYVGRHDSDDA